MSSENSANKTAPQSARPAAGHPGADAVAAAAGETEMSEATLAQLARICECLGAEPQRSLQMARQLVKRAGQLARERDWSEAQALEYLLSLMLKASGSDHSSQSPD